VSRRRPGRSHVAVMHVEQSRAKATIGSAFLALVMVAVAAAGQMYGSESWPDGWTLPDAAPENLPDIASYVAGVIALLAIISVVINGRRWRVARAVERLSDEPRPASSYADNIHDGRRPVATSIPTLTVDVVKSRKFPRPTVRIRQVTADRNIVGGRPLRIAFLRLFENEPRARTFMQSAWREFGYVTLLRSASSVSPSEYRQARRSGDLAGLFIDSPQQLERAIAQSDRRPISKGRHKLTTITSRKIKVRDRYGSYPALALLCHGSFWKDAIDMLLARVDLVVLDLSGFTPAHQGTQHELTRVVDRVPIQRVVFLTDPRSNKKFLVEQIQLVWRRMAAGSPNAGTQPKRAVIAITDALYSRTVGSSGPSGTPGQAGYNAGTQGRRELRLDARRRQTRKVAFMAQSRLAS
jgi:hypothetical protein